MLYVIRFIRNVVTEPNKFIESSYIKAKVQYVHIYISLVLSLFKCMGRLYVYSMCTYNSLNRDEPKSSHSYSLT